MINFSIKRPIAMTMILLTFIVLGAYCYYKLSIDQFPDIDFPYITVTTVYPGASPEEVEEQISKKIEDAVSEVDGIKHIRSTSVENISQVFIEFEMGVNSDFAAMDVREKIDLIKSDLPDDAEEPVILKFNVNAKPVMNLFLSSKKKSLKKLTFLVDDFLKDQLSKIQGVATVDVVGERRREIQILVGQNKSLSKGISLPLIINFIAKSNLKLPAGHIKENKLEYTIRTKAEVADIQEISDFPIPVNKNKTIKLKEIADVVDTYEEPKESAFLNNKRGLGLVIKKKADANTVKVVDRIIKKLPQINKMLPEGVELTLVNEDSKFIRDSIKDVNTNIIEGIILTAILLFLFLHNIRTTIIAVISMPASIIATFLLIYFAGFTLNILTLMALALSVGILVTNSIVVLENIVRHLYIEDTVSKAALIGTKNIYIAVLASTLTNVVVFVPISFMSGMVGQFFKSFGLTIVFATIFSLFISFTMVPMLSALIMKKRKKEKMKLFQLWDKMFEKISSIYLKILKYSIRHKTLVIVISIILLVLSFKLSSYIGKELITESDNGELLAFVQLPPGTKLEQTESVFKQVFMRLKDFKEIKKTFTKIGVMEGMFGKATQSPNVGQMLIKLTDKRYRIGIKELEKQIRQKLEDIPGARILVQQISGIGGAESPIQLEISGKDLNELRTLSEKILGIVRKTPGAVDVDSTLESGKPEINFYPNRQKIADAGLSISDIAMNLRFSIEGEKASKFRVMDKEYDIRVKLSEKDRKFTQNINDYLISVKNNKTIKLSSLGKIVYQTGPSKIIRKDKQRVVIISANLHKRPLGDVVNDIENKLKNIKFKQGYFYYFGGQVERMKESFSDIFVTLVLAIILTYIVLAGVLESFIHPFTIMLTLPLALIGVFVFLFITNQTINIMSLMAIVMLVGIVVNNAILLIDYIYVKRDEGLDLEESVIQACPVRLRPIIMTSLAIIIGMLPLALGQGFGAEMRKGMAIATIGGLSVSGILTLLVIPCMYIIFEKLKKNILKK